MDTRKIAGDIVRDEVARLGMRREDAAQRGGMAKSTFALVLAGKPVADLTLRQVEGVLGFPRRFLTYVIDGDTDTIANLDGVDADLRRLALSALSDPRESVQRTRGQANGGV